jgi:hypothetical protein
MNRRLAFLALIAMSMTRPAAAAPDAEALKKACHDDYAALCQHVMPGGGRIIACLNQHEDKLSASCKAALKK